MAAIHGAPEARGSCLLWAEEEETRDWEAWWGAHCARHASLRRLDSSTAAPPMRKMQPGMHMLRCLPR